MKPVLPEPRNGMHWKEMVFPAEYVQSLIDQAYEAGMRDAAPEGWIPRWVSMGIPRRIRSHALSLTGAEEMSITDTEIEHAQRHLKAWRSVTSRPAAAHIFEFADLIEHPIIKKIARLESALSLIAAPMRPDGTWNRDREACRVLAAETLEAMK